MAYDRIWPTQTRSGGYPIDTFALKIPYFHSGRNNFKSEVNTWVFIDPSHQGFLLQRENTKKSRNRSAYECYFRK